MDAAQCPQQPQNHSYATRIRQNIVIKPSNRLRHSPEPQRKPKHNQHSSPAPSSSKQVHTISPRSPSEIPDFPPPHVILHKDDSTSKVFLAIARSLLSVDNRATTVKDLADLAVNNGLGCQNSSAATQAITTYLRVHNERCEADHDQPLLLSHNLSGTDADDDLIPALYSLQGGNPRKASPTRATNFRKNTAVWYLSRATGAPCPFARAGIRLCDYVGTTEDVDERDSKRKRSKRGDPQVAGQKRKRPLRSCVAKGSSDSESDNEVDKRPPKKLTLRIKLNCSSLNRASGSRLPETPTRNISDDDSNDSSDDSMEVDSSSEEEQDEIVGTEKKEEEEWRLPPYPRRSISIPCYTPSYEGSYPAYPIPSDYRDPFRRSPSIPCSIGSPPPDSEDEADDFHITMTRTASFPEALTSDSDLESEDGETNFESPGPRSPSAPLLPPSARVTVKEESRDVQGMLDAWDDFDSSFAETKTAHTDSEGPPVNPQLLDLWDWDSEPAARIKQEDLTFDSLFPSTSSLSPPPSLSPPSSTFDSDSSPPSQGEGVKADLDDEWLNPNRNGTVRPRSRTVPTFSFSQTPAGPTSFPVPPPPALTTRNNSISGTTAESATIQPNLTHSLASLIQSMNSLCSSSGISPSSLILPNTSQFSSTSTSDVAVVVHTCQPCKPSISATQIEDISVYQMITGNFHFLRRIDTDFVNLSPIVNYAKSPFPVLSTIPNATVITKGSPSVAGIWVPLSAAQTYVKDHPAKKGEFDIFLSDQLFERFPTALQDFHRSNAPGRLLNQFGRHFGSTLYATAQQQQQALVSAAEMLARQQQQQQQLSVHMTLPPLIVIPSSMSDAYALSPALTIVEKQHGDLKEPPLSATEQEIFELCVVPVWDKDSSAPSAPASASLPGVTPELEEGGGEDTMEVEEGQEGEISDASSLTSLESISSPEASLKECEVGRKPSDIPPPPPPSSSPLLADAAPSLSLSIQAKSAQKAVTNSEPIGSSGEMETVVETRTAPTRSLASRASANTPAAPTMEEESGSRSNRPLRRSKRVADLVASHQDASPISAANARTRSRRRGSRNSLS